MGMKKLLWIIPVALTGTLLLVAGGIYLTIMDHGKSDYTPEMITNEQLIQRQLVRSFKDTKKSKKIDFNLDQGCLNQLLYNATEEIRNDQAFNGIVGDFYCKIDGNTYKFYVNTDLKAIKTRVILSTKLSEKDDNYVFEIKDIKLGNFPAKWIVDATGVLKQVNLNSVFKDAGLNIKADIDNDRLVYSKEDMRKDMLELMSNPSKAQGSEKDLLKGALETFEFNYKISGGINVAADLTNNIGNSTISDDRYDPTDASKTSNHNSVYAQALEKVKDTMDTYEAMTKVLTTTEDQLSNTTKEGFDSLKELGDPNFSINDEIKDDITSHPADYYTSKTINEQVAKITENDIDKYLRASDVIGKHFVVHYKSEIAYIVVDNMFCDIFTKENEGVKDAYMNFTVGINISGLETHLIIETKCTPSATEFKATFAIEHIYYGQVKASDSLEKVAKEIFKEAVNPDTNKAWISYDGETDSMSVDFEKILDTEYLDTFALGTKTFYLDKVGSSVEDVGQLQLWFNFVSSL